MFKTTNFSLVAALLSLLHLGGVQAGNYNSNSRGTIWDIVKGDSRFDTLETALRRTGLKTVLDGSDKYTVLAPTDGAFRDLFSDLGISSLSKVDDDTLTEILLYHVIGGRIFSDDLSDGQVATVQGSKVDVDVQSISRGKIYFNDAKVIDADIKADNGVIHVIDAVLIPPTNHYDDDDNDDDDDGEPVHYDDDYNPAPAPAPTPEPCHEEPTATYDDDYEMDDYLYVEPEEPSHPNLIDLIDDDDRFDILYNCLKIAGLKSAIADGDDLTIFGPTDGAFRDFFDDAGVHGCGDFKTSDLQDVLLYHVVGDLLFSFDLEDGDRLTTLEGSTVKIDFRNNGRYVFVNDAKITDPDNLASNGVIHAIRKVLTVPNNHY